MNNTSTSGKLLASSNNEQPHDLDIRAFDSLGDVEMNLLAIVDRTTITLRDLAHLELDQLLTLSRPAGENIDLLVGDVLIGSAEILVADEKLAVRVAELREKVASPPGEK